jgi:hypothetical protein
MALTAQQQNFISELQAWANRELEQRQKAEELNARWNLNQFNQKLSDEDIQAIGSFSHLTAQIVTDGVVAMQEVLQALGDDVDGYATNLYRLKG